MKNFYIALHKPTGKYLKYDEINMDGFGFYVPSIKVEDFDLTSSCDTPAMFSSPKLPYNFYLLSTHNWRDQVTPPLTDLIWMTVEVHIVKA